MTNFEKFKQALTRKKEEEYAKLMFEVKKLKENIELFLESFFESTTSQSQTKYSGLNMY